MSDSKKNETLWEEVDPQELEVLRAELSPKDLKRIERPQAQEEYQAEALALIPEEVTAVVAQAEEWVKLDPPQREELRERFASYEALPSPEKDTLERRWKRFQAMSPSEQDALIRKYRA